MANRYWVGGSGTWNSSSTTNWSASSGGSPGASVPTSSDDVYIDQNGPYTITYLLPSSSAIKSLNVTGTNVTITSTGGNYQLTLTSNLYLNATTTLFTSGSIGFSLEPPAGTTAYIDWACPNQRISSFTLGVGGATGTCVVLSDFSSSMPTNRTFNIFNGVFNLNNKTINCDNFYVNSGTVDFSSSSVVATARSVSIYNGSTLSGTGKLLKNGTLYQDIDIKSGVNASNITVETATSSAIYIISTGSSGIANIQNIGSAQLVFYNGNQFNEFSLSGTAGNIVGIKSSVTGTTATISKPSGTVNVSYCNIRDSIATGGATWNAFLTNGNVNGGNNTGWNFTAPATCNFFPLFP